MPSLPAPRRNSASQVDASNNEYNHFQDQHVSALSTANPLPSTSTPSRTTRIVRLRSISDNTVVFVQPIIMEHEGGMTPDMAVAMRPDLQQSDSSGTGTSGEDTDYALTETPVTYSEGVGSRRYMVDRSPDAEDIITPLTSVSGHGWTPSSSAFSSVSSRNGRTDPNLPALVTNDLHSAQKRPSRPSTVRQSTLR